MRYGIMLSVWFLLALAGFLPLLRYEETQGQPIAAKQDWPRASTIARNGSLQLIMFLHPQCPCSRASLSQLDRLMGTLDGQSPSVTLVFEQPASCPESWVKSGLWEQAGRFKHAARYIDCGQKEATIFGANTSGDTFLFNRDGKLLFHGGITQARGHEGDSIAYNKLVSAARTGQSKRPVCSKPFGCSLFNS